MPKKPLFQPAEPKDRWTSIWAAITANNLDLFKKYCAGSGFDMSQMQFGYTPLQLILQFVFRSPYHVFLIGTGTLATRCLRTCSSCAR